jgi:hypothetical protein
MREEEFNEAVEALQGIVCGLRGVLEGVRTEGSVPREVAKVVGHVKSLKGLVRRGRGSGVKINGEDLGVSSVSVVEEIENFLREKGHANEDPFT